VGIFSSFLCSRSFMVMMAQAIDGLQK